MIEVFKTNVMSHDQAELLMTQMENNFADYKVNFDLEDCDRILRVECRENINSKLLIDFMNTRGFKAEVLTDEIPQTSSIHQHGFAETLND